MTGPLAPFADAYRLELRERGYTPLTTVNQLRQVARLSRWLEASGLTVAQLSGWLRKFVGCRQAAFGRRSGSWAGSSWALIRSSVLARSAAVYFQLNGRAVWL